MRHTNDNSTTIEIAFCNSSKIFKQDSALLLSFFLNYIIKFPDVSKIIFSSTTDYHWNILLDTPLSVQR